MNKKPNRNSAISRMLGMSKKPPFAIYTGRPGPGRYKRNRPKVVAPVHVEDMEVSASQESATDLSTLWECKTPKDVGKWFNRGQRRFRKKVVRSLARRKLSDDQAETVADLIIKAGATSHLMLANEAVARGAYKELARRIVRLLASHSDWECVFVTAISGDGETSHTQTEIELFESQRRFASTCRAISPHFFGITELAIFNSQGHPGGGQRTSRHEHALVFGPGVRAQAALIAAKHADRYPPNFTGAPVLKVKSASTDSVNLWRMAAYLFKAPAKMMNWNPPKDDKPGHMNQSEKGDRYTRYLRLAYVRCLLTFEDVTFGGGEGNRIRGDMIRYLRSVSENEAKGGNRILHPDAVASFWVELAKALEHPWNLPIIKRSK